MLNASDLFVLRHDHSPGWIYKYLPGDAFLWSRITAGALAHKDSLRTAGIGAGEAQRVDAVYRGDSLRWMSEEYRAWRATRSSNRDDDGVHAAYALLAAVEEQLSRDLGGTVRLDPSRTSVQLALYPGDGHASYVRHRDCVVALGQGDTERGRDRGGGPNEQHAPHRVFTCILYANSPSWDVATDGGALRIFSHPLGWSAGRHSTPAHAPVDGEIITDVCPAGGRMVVFRSSSVEHAVQASTKARAAWTMWLYGWEEGDPPAALSSSMDSAGRAGHGAAPEGKADWAAVANKISKGKGSAADLLQAFLSPSPPRPVPSSAPSLAPAASHGHPLPTIFLLVPAYRDPQAVHTVLDALRAAQHPARVHAGIVWQWEECVDVSGSELPWWPGTPSVREREALGFTALTKEDVQILSSARVSHMTMDARCSSGPAWARALGSSMYRGEDWLLTVDAHSRGWLQGWDTLLVAQAAIAGKHAGAGKPVILSTYPQGYSLQAGGRQGGYEALLPGCVDRGTLGAVPDLLVQEEHDSALIPLPLPAHLSPTLLCPGVYAQSDGLLRFLGKRVQALPAGLVRAWQARVREGGIPGAESLPPSLLSYPCIPCPYLAGGLLLCPGSMWMRTLLPALLQLKGGFFGEEQCLAVAAAEAGAAIYAPALQVCYTLWERAGRPDHPPGWQGWREAVAGSAALDAHARGQAVAWASKEAQQFHAAVTHRLSISAREGSSSSGHQPPLMIGPAGSGQATGAQALPLPLPALAFASPPSSGSPQ